MLELPSKLGFQHVLMEELCCIECRRVLLKEPPVTVVLLVNCSCTLSAHLGLVNDKVLYSNFLIAGITIYNMIRFHLVSSFPFLFFFLFF
jgi:hypothetical protein